MDIDEVGFFFNNVCVVVVDFGVILRLRFWFVRVIELVLSCRVIEWDLDVIGLNVINKENGVLKRCL